MRAAALVLALAPALAAGGSAGTPPKPPPAGPPAAAPGAPAATEGLQGWKSLTLKAEGSSLYTGSMTLELSEGVHAASGRPAVIFSTRSEARLLGAIGLEERTTSWIDAATRRPLELLHLRPGEPARRFRFEPGQVVQTSWVPPADRPDAPLDQWREQESTTRKAVLPDGSPIPPGESVTDPYALIYLLREVDLSAPGGREFLVWKRRQVIRLKVTVGDRRANTRNVTDETQGKVIPLSLSERHLEITPSGEEGKDLRGLMGMQGPVEVWIDESSRAPVELRGTAPTLGPTVVALVSFRR